MIRKKYLGEMHFSCGQVCGDSKYYEPCPLSKGHEGSHMWIRIPGSSNAEVAEMVHASDLKSDA